VLFFFDFEKISLKKHVPFRHTYVRVLVQCIR
jgi:hypothetical protein